MKKQYILIVLTAFFLFGGKVSFGQLVGGNCFLQGRYLEIGMDPNASFGACTSPGTYHPHLGFGGTNLAEVYDYGHDGWTVGTPPYMGDYTYPGSPFEGWEVQCNVNRTQAFQNCAGSMTGGGGTLTGALTTYSNVGGRAIGNWAGSAYGGALVIKQETRVDTMASAVVVTTYFHNTSAAPVPQVYYMRSCDPDNDETWPGGGFSTNNTIIHQNEDATHRVLVSAVGASGAYAYLGLGTKDCRAVCFIYGSWPLSSGQDLAAVWNRTYAATYPLGATYNGDVGIGLVYKLGDIAPGDSTIISYAYIFNGNNGIDSAGALPDPQLMVNGVVVPNHDTFNTCAYPGLTSLPVGIKYGDDKDWSWSVWTWVPGTGLSATTGTTGLTIDINSLTGPTTYTVTGNDSGSHMNDCNHKVFVFTILPCHSAHNNSPCINDTLKLADSGSSVGTTYYWVGPGGFTSTMQNPWIYPSVFADSGYYKVIRTRGSVVDSDSTYVYIRPLPVLNLTTNTPLCRYATDTLRLGVTPFSAGETLTWSGPAGFTSTVQFPTVTPFVDSNTGTYKVIGVTIYGCVDSNTILATLMDPPPAPIITDRNYCQFQAFVPFTVSAVGTVYWWPGATGGVSTFTAPTVNTTVPGLYRVWASQKVGNCESARGTDSVRVTTKPPAPVVTGIEQYCQFIAPLDTLVVHTTVSGIPLWYTVPTGGTVSYTNLWPNLNVAGTYTFYVAQVDSGCYSDRTTVTEIIHPKPVAPSVTPYAICQYKTQGPLTCVLSDATDFATWFGNGIPATGTTVYPTPQTDTVKRDTFYVNETSVFGCVSDKTMDVIRVKAQPAAPYTHDTAYCQFATASPLNIGADSLANSTLNWYLAGTLLPPTPTPSTANVGNTTWYVSQTIEGCEGDSAALTVTIILQPSFTIKASSPWVCQYDSLTLEYVGAPLADAAYHWYFPYGDSLANGGTLTAPTTYVKFDTASDSTYVVLFASDDFGKCWAFDTLRIKVVPHPVAVSYTKQDVCQGDTTSLAITTKTDNAYNYIWTVNGTAPYSSTPLFNSSAVIVVSANSNTGGPYNISWLDTGMYIIQLNTFTEEGCTSKPTFDTVHVHAIPNSTFRIELIPNTLCIEDSVLFIANVIDYRLSYAWAPEHSFTNANLPEAWGRVEQSSSDITLTVTDPFGCYSKSELVLNPGTCCTVAFPNAFTPNGDGHNDVFKPLYQGFHRFHEFRIQNRWGQTVFNSANSDNSWDGNYNGVPQDMGVYYYYISYDCGGKTIEETGDVTLVR